jgi:long-chain acyl-CoA synthetase
MEIQATSPKTDLLAGKKNGNYELLSTEKVHAQVQQLAAGLIEKGISKGDGTTEGRDKIGLISNSRPEWLITDLAVQLSGAILVPLYPNITTQELVHIFQESGVKGCFVHSKELYQTLLSAKAQLPSLQWIYCFEIADGIPSWDACKIKVPTTNSLQQIQLTKDTTKETDIATIIYTSGTTGKPKGVMLSHKNIVSNVMSVKDVLEEIGLKEKIALSFLPLNHIYEKTLSYIYFFYDFSIYYAESMETIGANLKEVRPTIFVTVPRLLEKVYEKIMNTGHQLTGVKKALFFWAVNLGKKYNPGETRSGWYNFQLRLANKLIFSKWREALGGRVKAIVVGGAACQPRLVKIFTAGEIIIMEGYGLTETSPVLAVNRFHEENRRASTVGPLINNVEVKIAPDGEILCKGDNVMVGYYKQPEATAEVFVEGWFATGDIGEFVEGKFLKITDRKKELFKTSGGKYVAPQPIENTLKESRYIEQVMLIGAGRKFVSALIVPNFEVLQQYMKEQNIPFESNKAAIEQPQVKHLFKSILNQYNPDFNHVEQIKQFILLDRLWTVEDGELTPKLSLKRKVILNKLENQIEELYQKYQVEL